MKEAANIPEAAVEVLTTGDVISTENRSDGLAKARAKLTVLLSHEWCRYYRRSHPPLGPSSLVFFVIHPIWADEIRRWPDCFSRVVQALELYPELARETFEVGYPYHRPPISPLLYLVSSQYGPYRPEEGNDYHLEGKQVELVEEQLFAANNNNDPDAMDIEEGQEHDNDPDAMGIEEGQEHDNDPDAMGIEEGQKLLAKLRGIQRVYSLYPDAIKVMDEEGWTILHILAEDGDLYLHEEATDMDHQEYRDILQFFASKCAEVYPEAFGLRDSSGELPIHKVLGKNDLLVMLVEACPSSIGLPTSRDGFSLLEAVFREVDDEDDGAEDFNPELLNLLVATVAQDISVGNMTALSISYLSDQFQGGDQRFQLFRLVLPRLKKFEWNVANDNTGRHLPAFLRVLPEASLLTRLDLGCLSPELMATQDACDTLQLTLEVIPSLRHLALSMMRRFGAARVWVVNGGMPHDSRCLEALYDALPSLQQLEELEVGQFWLIDTDLLTGIMTIQGMPHFQRLCLRNCLVKGGRWNADIDPNAFAACPFTTLDLQHCEIRGDSAIALLQQLAHCPRLTSLAWSKGYLPLAGNLPDLNPEFHALVNRLPLVKLHFELPKGFRLSTDVVLNTVRNSATLRDLRVAHLYKKLTTRVALLEILRRQNFVLEQLHWPSFLLRDQQYLDREKQAKRMQYLIEYYTVLNRLGRHTETPNLTQAQFVNLLGQLNTDAALSELESHGFMLELLLEVPAIWCHRRSLSSPLRRTQRQLLA